MTSPSTSRPPPPAALLASPGAAPVGQLVRPLGGLVGRVVALLDETHEPVEDGLGPLHGHVGPAQHDLVPPHDHLAPHELFDPPQHRIALPKDVEHPRGRYDDLGLYLAACRNVRRDSFLLACQRFDFSATGLVIPETTAAAPARRAADKFLFIATSLLPAQRAPAPRRGPRRVAWPGP